MQRRRWIAAAAMAMAIGACGGSGGGYSTGVNAPPGTQPNPGAGNPNTNQVTLMEQSFSPSSITVPAGTTVTWTWQSCDSSSGGYGSSTSCVTHNVTFDDGSGVASPTQNSGTFARTFATPGTYKYHCGIHGAAVMSGQVTVQ